MNDPAKKRLWTPLIRSGLLALGALSLAQAATTDIDFNSDPAGTGLYISNTSEPTPWRATGGVGDSGYLAINDAREGQSSHLLFKDFEPGFVMAAMWFSCDLRIGGGTARPADGFSLNIISGEDPTIAAMEGGGAPTYAGTDGEPSLPEEGSRTGLGIGFDTWQSGAITGMQDVVGISVRVNGALVAQFPVPLQPDNVYVPGETNPNDYANEIHTGGGYTYDGVPNRNRATDDANYAWSMQTGALNSVDVPDANSQQPAYGDANWGNWVKNLTWEKFEAQVTQEGKVIIKWKGVELTPAGGLQTDFTPIPGRILFGGRTGGAWEVHHVDNIHLETEAALEMLVGNATGTPTGFAVTISDSGPSILDPATLAITLDGNPVTPTDVSKNGGTTTIKYNDLAAPFVAGSVHTVGVSASDTNGNAVENEMREFTVPDFLTLDPALAVAGANTPGFVLDVYHIDPAGAGVPNNVLRAERQLHGDLGANVSLDTVSGLVMETFVETGVINYAQDDEALGDLLPVAAGNFTAASTPSKPDVLIPGMNVWQAGVFPYTDNLALRVNTVLHLTEVGTYEIIFNSDDGFRTLAHNNGREQLNSTIVSQADVGKGASDVTQLIYVGAPGYYPMSTDWFEGGGGASLEWAIRTPSSGGTAILINDTEPGAVKAYQVATGDIPSAVVFTDPVRNSGNPYPPNAPITIDIANGTTPVNTGSIKLLVNGAEVGATVTPTADGATVSYTPAAPYPGGTVEVTVEFDGYSGSYTFTASGWTAVPPSLALNASDVTSEPNGFVIRTVQMDNGDGFGTSVYGANTVLAGLLGKPNLADPADFDPDGWYREYGVINYEQASADAGNFNPSGKMPGVPGLEPDPNDKTNDFALEILTVLHFPQAGLYYLGFNSDDGFSATIGNPKDRMPVQVGVADVGKGASDVDFLVSISQPGYYPVRIAYFEGGGGASCEFSSRTLPDLLGNSTRTLVNDTGGIAAFMYPLDNAGAPYVAAYGPAIAGRGNNTPLTGTVNLWLEDGATPVAAISSMTYDGAAVTPTVMKSGTTTHVTYAPDALLAEGQTVPVEVQVGDRTLAWSFTTETGDAPTGDVVFFIEAEDFNNNGAAQAEASTMPYLGGAYAGLSAVDGVDYNGPNVTSSPLVRIGEEPPVPIERNDDRDRGIVEVQANFAIGWGGSGHWYNYTRDFPTGEYNVWVAVSDGDGNRIMAGSMDLVGTGPLGTFSAQGTGGWNNNDLVPLKDDNGNLVKAALGGTQTVQLILDGNENIDYILFTVPGEGGDIPVITSIVNNGDGTITVEWTGGGVLEAATEVTGPWEVVEGAVSGSPIPMDPDAPAVFGRIRVP